MTTALKEKFPDVTDFEINESLYRIECEAVRTSILKNNKRPDGRGARDIRPLHCEVGLLPRTHGSAIFQRGETQALVHDHARLEVRHAGNGCLDGRRRPRSGSSCITISRRSASAKRAARADPAAARSVTARWRSVPSSR